MTKGGRRYWRMGLAVGLVAAVALGMLLAVPLSTASSSVNARSTLASGVVTSVLAVAGDAKAKSKPCATETNPEYVAYDPVNKDFYVSDAGSAAVSVYSKTCTLVTTISLAGSSPRGIAYDPTNNYMFVAGGSDQVFVISGTSVEQTLTSSTYFDETWAIAYDPAGGYFASGGCMIVSNAAGDTIDWLCAVPSTGTYGIEAVYGVGDAPDAICYSPTYNALMVANFDSGNVTSIDASTGVYLDHSIGVGSEPTGIVTPATSLYTYVSNFGSDNVTVIDPYGSTRISISVGSEPHFIAFDQDDLDLFVSNFGSNSLSVIDESNAVVQTIKMPSGCGPIGSAYNYNENTMDVVCWGTDKVYVES